MADPRRKVLVGTALAVMCVVALGSLLATKADSAQVSVRYARTSTRRPIDALDATLAANAAGQRQLSKAAAATGDERNTFLAESIASGEASARAWSRYQAVALPLEGEPGLAARYERDYRAGKAVATGSVIPILRSTQPQALPPEQIDSADRDQRDLLALGDLYEREEAATLDRLDHWAETAAARARLASEVGVALVLLVGVLAWRGARRVLGERRLHAEAADLDLFETRVIRALELADTDDEAFAIAATATAEAAPGAVVSLIASDASGTTFTSAVGFGPCGVTSPERCPSIRAGVPLHFADSTALDACPRLADRATDACSVTCLPVAVAGRDMAVLQLTMPVGTAPQMSAGVRVVVRRSGERITMMRAFAQFELQASRDPLTGLHNRRSLEAAVEQLRAAGTSYTVAFADLDHFKRLNDVHGHDAGDRALRAFAGSLTSGLRPEDLSCRWGGEEFLVVLPDCDEAEAAEAMSRIQAAIAVDRRSGRTAVVTVSVGVSREGHGEPFADVVGRADEALRRAKTTGRDRVVIWSPPTPALATPA